MSDPAYPIGHREPFAGTTPEQFRERLSHLAALPAELRAAVDGLTDAQLDAPYREGGWTPRQVVHHVADAHMLAFLACKLALTEENPAWPGWSQPAFGELPDARTAPVQASLRLVDGVHERWVLLFGSLGDEQFGRTYVTATGGQRSLAEALHIYAWHGRHHVAQITGLRSRERW